MGTTGTFEPLVVPAGTCALMAILDVSVHAPEPWWNVHATHLAPSLSQCAQHAAGALSVVLAYHTSPAVYPTSCITDVGHCLATTQVKPNMAVI